MTVTEIEDAERKLLVRIADGDEQAFAVLFYTYAPVLHGFAVRFVKSADDADEVVQNAFMRVWLGRDKLESVTNFRSWLYKVASNECLNFLRSASRAREAGISIVPHENALYEDQGTPGSVKLNEISSLIEKAVRMLPARRRHIYILSRQEGLSIPEIAGQLGISPNTVKNALVTSLKSIRDYLSMNGYSFSLIFLLFFKK